MTQPEQHDDTSAWKRISAAWFLNNLFILSFFVTLSIAIHALFAFSTPQFPTFFGTLEQKATLVDSFTSFYSAVGLIPLIFLLLLTVLFYLPWIDSLKELGQALPSIIRDLLAIITFACFAALMTADKGAVDFFDFDYLRVSLLLTVFLLVLISNFGGLEEEATDTLKALGVTAAMVVVAHLPELVATQKLRFSWFLFVILDLSLIYIVTIAAKIVFFPDDMVTFELKTRMKKVGFAFLALVVLLPFCGLAFSLLLALPTLLIAYLCGTEVVNDQPGVLILSHIWIVGGYLLGMLRHNPLSFVSFFVAVLYNLAGFARRMGSDREISSDSETERRFLFRLCQRVVVSDSAETSRAFLVLGGLSVAINVGYLVFFVR